MPASSLIVIAVRRSRSDALRFTHIDSMERTLVVLHGSVPLAAVQSLISEQGISADQADVTTDPSSSTGTSGYARAVCVGSKADAVLLGAVAKLLKPGAKALLQLHGGSEVITKQQQHHSSWLTMSWLTLLLPLYVRRLMLAALCC